jgi:hypothetical protein
MHVAMPCEVFHLGNAQAAGELDAHRGMVVEGAALDVVDEKPMLIRLEDANGLD